MDRIEEESKEEDLVLSNWILCRSVMLVNYHVVIVTLLIFDLILNNNIQTIRVSISSINISIDFDSNLY